MPKTSPFAKRTNWILETNNFSKNLNRLHKENKPLLDLTESNPTCCAFSFYGRGIISSLDNEMNLGYAPSSRGSLDARKAICCYFKDKGYEVSPNQIFLTASTSEAYSYLFRLLVDPGGKVLFPRPSYPLFAFLGDLNDIHLDYYPIDYEKKWGIDINEMRHNISDDTKAIVLVNPNNPTGSFICSDELESINAICRSNNSALICDEVFSDFAFDQNCNHVSLVGNEQVLTFTLGGISKALGLPQMKLSWIIVNGPKKLIEAANERLEVIADTYLSVNTPTQNALAKWLPHRNAIQKEMNERIIQNYKYLKERLELVNNCELLDSEGGWYAVIKIPDSLTEEQWVLMFLNQDYVVVHPGYFFDFTAETFIVISLLPIETIFRDGIRRILNRINEESLQKAV